MSQYFTMPGGQTIATIDIGAGGVTGSGRGELPLLAIPLNLRLRCPEDQRLAIYFREIRCRVSPFDGTYIAESRSCWLNIRLASGQELTSHLAYLEVPLDRPRLAVIDRLRRGGDAKLRLDLELHADELGEISRTGALPNASLWGLRAHQLLRAEVQVTVPRSAWVEQILTATEFAKTHIIELPAIPIEGTAQVKRAYDALCQAQKLEKEGYVNEAVGQCRIALECFCEPAEKTDSSGQKVRALVLKASWETRLGKATFDWLAACFSAMKQPTNKPHHPSSAQFDRLEAQMLLMITTALVAYAVHAQPVNSS